MRNRDIAQNAILCNAEITNYSICNTLSLQNRKITEPIEVLLLIDFSLLFCNWIVYLLKSRCSIK